MRAVNIAANFSRGGGGSVGGGVALASAVIDLGLRVISVEPTEVLDGLPGLHSMREARVDMRLREAFAKSFEYMGGRSFVRSLSPCSSDRGERRDAELGRHFRLFPSGHDEVLMFDAEGCLVDTAPTYTDLGGKMIRRHFLSQYECKKTGTVLGVCSPVDIDTYPEDWARVVADFLDKAEAGGIKKRVVRTSLNVDAALQRLRRNVCSPTFTANGISAFPIVPEAPRRTSEIDPTGWFSCAAKALATRSSPPTRLCELAPTPRLASKAKPTPCSERRPT